VPQDSSFIQFPSDDSQAVSLQVQSVIDSLRYDLLHQQELAQIEGHADPGGDQFAPFLLIAFFIILVVRARRKDNRLQDAEHEVAAFIAGSNTPPPRSYLVYPGRDLQFSDTVLHTILTRYFPHYNSLQPEGQTRFTGRVKKFIRHKQFIIHAESGFREMPVLVSASAIQFSFGFDDFLLPQFRHIHIYPEAFIGTYPSLRFLEGNVSGRSVRLSWKHFLNGYQYPHNGENVGLHEFAHAYHLQFTTHQEWPWFAEIFQQFSVQATRICADEQLPGRELYPDYALKNADEFWAGTVELFFERPADLAKAYPDLFETLCRLLRQRPSVHV